MTVREAKNICDKVTLSDCIFFEGTTAISGIKPSCDVSYEKFREAWKRLERFYGIRRRGKNLVNRKERWRQKYVRITPMGVAPNGADI